LWNSSWGSHVLGSLPLPFGLGVAWGDWFFLGGGPQGEPGGVLTFFLGVWGVGFFLWGGRRRGVFFRSASWSCCWCQTREGRMFGKPKLVEQFLGLQKAHRVFFFFLETDYQGGQTVTPNRVALYTKNGGPKFCPKMKLRGSCRGGGPYRRSSSFLFPHLQGCGNEGKGESSFVVGFFFGGGACFFWWFFSPPPPSTWGPVFWFGFLVGTDGVCSPVVVFFFFPAWGLEEFLLGGVGNL